MGAVAITFDLEAADATDYQTAYAALARLGFTRCVGKVRTPTTTVLGDSELSAQALCERAKTALEAKGLTVSHIFAGRLSDWKIWGPRC